MAEGYSPADRLLDAVSWKPLPQPTEDQVDGTPYATHDGWLNIGAIKLKCFQLSDGRRVIEEKSLLNWLEQDA